MARPPGADLENAMSIMKLLRTSPQARDCSYPRSGGFSQHQQPQHPESQQHHHHLHHHPHHHHQSSRHQHHPRQHEHRDAQLPPHLSQQHPLIHPLALTKNPSVGFGYGRTPTVPNASCMEATGNSGSSSTRSKLGRHASGSDAVAMSELRASGGADDCCGRPGGPGGNSSTSYRRGSSTFGSSNRTSPEMGHRRARSLFSKSNTPSPSDDVFILSQQGDLRLSGRPSGQGAGGRTRTRDSRVPADLRADSLATVPPTLQDAGKRISKERSLKSLGRVPLAPIPRADPLHGDLFLNLPAEFEFTSGAWLDHLVCPTEKAHGFRLALPAHSGEPDCSTV
ncbi:hypothetical protein PoB_001587900 [Plakobranchus ocellatus]|uniref:Uncharacterized protein n=1 Tax=Plakobranchus ocellatus TaxID=259542 RepID=A0AAV3Z4S6_9GAST|nr:hypothetical protein PoB_001587900 [Plakobranchus ocellatus]